MPSSSSSTEVVLRPRCSVVRSVRIEAMVSPINKTGEYSAGRLLLRLVSKIRRWPGVVGPAHALRRLDRARRARCDRLRFAMRRLRLVSVVRRSTTPPLLALSDGLPHFRFLVLRGIFVKLRPAGSCWKSFRKLFIAG